MSRERGLRQRFLCSGGGGRQGAEGGDEAEPAGRAATEPLVAGSVGVRVQPHGHPHGCCAVLLPALRRRRLHDVVLPLQAQLGRQAAAHDGQPDPRVVAAHGARAPVLVGRCAHDCGGEAARRCGAVCVARPWHVGDCEGRGGHGAV
ncbi:mucin-associated surface protein (MASP) [Trypanosoma cruzi]|nr:mucin-associated surface protein (MASP) [Trypanosoma cruzi]